MQLSSLGDVTFNLHETPVYHYARDRAYCNIKVMSIPSTVYSLKLVYNNIDSSYKKI